MAKNDKVEKPTKHWLTALLLCWFLGLLGIHRLYVGKIGSGFLMAYGTLVAFVVMGALVVNDFVLIALKKFKDCYGREIVEEKLG